MVLWIVWTWLEHWSYSVSSAKQLWPTVTTRFMIRTPRTLRRWELCVTHRDQNPRFSQKCSVAIGSILHSSSPNCGTRFSDSLMPSTPMRWERWKASLILHSEIKRYLACEINGRSGKITLRCNVVDNFSCGLAIKVGTCQSRHNQPAKRVLDHS